MISYQGNEKLYDIPDTLQKKSAPFYSGADFFPRLFLPATKRLLYHPHLQLGKGHGRKRICCQIFFLTLRIRFRYSEPDLFRPLRTGTDNRASPCSRLQDIICKPFCRYYLLQFAVFCSGTDYIFHHIPVVTVFTTTLLEYKPYISHRFRQGYVNPYSPICTVIRTEILATPSRTKKGSTVVINQSILLFHLHRRMMHRTDS